MVHIVLVIATDSGHYLYFLNFLCTFFFQCAVTVSVRPAILVRWNWTKTEEVRCHSGAQIDLPHAQSFL
jgi:hypothetical protein